MQGSSGRPVRVATRVEGAAPPGRPGGALPRRAAHAPARTRGAQPGRKRWLTVAAETAPRPADLVERRFVAQAPEPALGLRPHLSQDARGIHLSGLRQGCLLAHHRRLPNRKPPPDRLGAGRARDGGPPAPADRRRTRASHRSRQPVHELPLHPALADLGIAASVGSVGSVADAYDNAMWLYAAVLERRARGRRGRCEQEIVPPTSERRCTASGTTRCAEDSEVSEGTRTPDRRDHNPTKPVLPGWIRLSEAIRVSFSCSDLRSKLSPPLTPWRRVPKDSRAAPPSSPPAGHAEPRGHLAASTGHRPRDMPRREATGARRDSADATHRAEHPPADQCCRSTV
jgi:hypothetical protein